MFENLNETMFGNIGGKIKGLAKVLCWIGIISSVIAAIVMLFSAMDAWRGSEKTMFTILFFVILIVGPILSWLSSIALYAFGELVEDIHAIRKKECPIVESNNVEEDDSATNTNNEERIFSCPNCNSTVYYGEPVCKACGQKFDWTNV